MNDKTTPPDWKQQLDKIIESRGQNNNICADCFKNASDSLWGCWNHGIFVCIKCAGIHRQIGVHISKVKSTQFDKWKNNELTTVKQIGGNMTANKKLECRKPKYFVNPSECDDLDDVRKFYIKQKYEMKLFEKEHKDDAGIHEMPQKVLTGTFLQENNKKKAYLQLLDRKLYFFKNNYDSYATEKFDCTKINIKLSTSNSNNTDYVLNISNINNNNVSIYRLRTTQQNTITQLINFTHYIRRAKQYYNYKDNEQKEIEIENKQSEPLKEIKLSDLKDGTILGIASKKGGGARSWRKRWWILLNNILYYFKDDFRTNKKSKGIGIPQGNIPLYNADIIWDKDRTRTNKQNAFMICTPNRTFYVQPQQQFKDNFYNIIDSCCNRLWNRKPFDFVTMG